MNCFGCCLSYHMLQSRKTLVIAFFFCLERNIYSYTIIPDLNSNWNEFLTIFLLLSFTKYWKIHKIWQSSCSSTSIDQYIYDSFTWLCIKNIPAILREIIEYQFHWNSYLIHLTIYLRYPLWIVELIYTVIIYQNNHWRNVEAYFSYDFWDMQ